MPVGCWVLGLMAYLSTPFLSMKLSYSGSKTRKFWRRFKRFHSFGLRRKSSSRVHIKSYCFRKDRENMLRQPSKSWKKNLMAPSQQKMPNMIMTRSLTNSISITPQHSVESWKAGMRNGFKKRLLKIRSFKSYMTALFKSEICRRNKPKWSNNKLKTRLRPWKSNKPLLKSKNNFNHRPKFQNNKNWLKKRLKRRNRRCRKRLPTSGPRFRLHRPISRTQDKPLMPRGKWLMRQRGWRIKPIIFAKKFQSCETNLAALEKKQPGYKTLRLKNKTKSKKRSKKYHKTFSPF